MFHIQENKIINCHKAIDKTCAKAAALTGLVVLWIAKPDSDANSSN